MSGERKSINVLARAGKKELGISRLCRRSATVTDRGGGTTLVYQLGVYVERMQVIERMKRTRKLCKQGILWLREFCCGFKASSLDRAFLLRNQTWTS